MAEMLINSAQIRAQADHLNDLNVQFQSQVNELKNIKATLNSSWDGEARATFHNAFSSDVAQMDNFYKTINEYIVALMQIAARFEQAEARNVEVATERTYH